MVEVETGSLDTGVTMRRDITGIMIAIVVLLGAIVITGDRTGHGITGITIGTTAEMITGATATEMASEADKPTESA